jgi:hypothetical protein
MAVEIETARRRFTREEYPIGPRHSAFVDNLNELLVTRLADAADTHLLIEVAETSLRFDRSIKLRLYAETGTGARATVSPLAFPDVALLLAEVFA